MPKAVALLLCTVGLSGCLTSNVLVTVRPDGSGTLEYTTIVRPAALAEFEKLLPPELAGTPTRPAADIADPRRWLPEERIGRDVRLLSVKPVKTAETAGWALAYEFDDVTALDLDLIMERLTVRFPRFAMDTSAEPPSSWASGSPEEMAALRNVMKGSRITLAVKTEAPLIRTNSSYRNENRVTLLDADIEQAMFSKQIAMLVATPATFEELLTIFADLPGVTLAREQEITLDSESVIAAADGRLAACPSAGRYRSLRRDHVRREWEACDRSADQYFAESGIRQSAVVHSRRTVDSIFLGARRRAAAWARFFNCGAPGADGYIDTKSGRGRCGK